MKIASFSFLNRKRMRTIFKRFIFFRSKIFLQPSFQHLLTRGRRRRLPAACLQHGLGQSADKNSCGTAPEHTFFNRTAAVTVPDEKKYLVPFGIDLQWFAAEDEGRTEEATEYRLQQARREGRVAKSAELSSSVVLLLTVAALIVYAPSLLRTCVEVFRFYFARSVAAQIDDPAFFTAFVRFFLRMLLPIAGIGIIGGLAGNIIQTRGFIFSWKPITPNFGKVVPKFGEYFRKTLFSFQGVFNVAKSIGKLVILVSIAWFLIQRDIPIIALAIQNGNVQGAVGKISMMSAQLLVIAAIIFLAISIPDYFVQRREFLESMKMTKQEVKQEYKELEGDPQIKARLRQAHLRLMQQNMPRAVAESDVVITNPTHFAVALKYDQARSLAPEVTAKGEDSVAFAMRRIARENNVPVIEDRSLARGLYTDTKIGDIIPERYLKAIAVIYAHDVLKNT